MVTERIVAGACSVSKEKGASLSLGAGPLRARQAFRLFRGKRPMCWSCNSTSNLLVALAFVLALLAHAGEQLTGEVVGITDGDTLRVMRDGNAVQRRLYGIALANSTPGQPMSSLW